MVAALTPPEVEVSLTDENVTAFFELTGRKNSEQIKIARRLSQETGSRVIATRDDMRFDLKQPSNS